MMKATVQDINACLPQTQCGLCGFAGCKPYAEALADGSATPDLCPPGGLETLQALGQVLTIDISPYTAKVIAQTKPPSVAKVIEAECIGCTKCIKACPVDAIIGSAKHMHSVITAECTGCELCLPACPVDCIEMLITPAPIENKSQQFQQRFEARNLRLKHENIAKQQAPLPLADSKSYLAAALARAQAKKAGV